MRTAPVRPHASPAPPTPERRWLPVVAVLAVVAFVTGGSRIVDAAISSSGEPVVVGGDVTVTPRPGWEVVRTSTEPGAETAVLRRGTAGLLVLALEGSVPALQLADRYQETLEDRFATLAVGGRAVDGVGRVRFGYYGITNDGVPVEGVVTVVSAPSGVGAVFDGFAPKGGLAAAVDDLGRMVTSAEVGGP